MDTALILADELLAVIRKSGVSKMEASAALAIAGHVLPTISDISFRSDVEAPTAAADPG